MSSKKPTRRELNQLINVCCGAHDLICDCDEPTKHIILHLFSHQEPYQVTKQQKDNIQKCLITTEDHGEPTAIVGDDGINEGDLEAIFAEDKDGEDAEG